MLNSGQPETLLEKKWSQNIFFSFTGNLHVLPLPFCVFSLLYNNQFFAYTTHSDTSLLYQYKILSLYHFGFRWVHEAAFHLFVSFLQWMSPLLPFKNTLIYNLLQLILISHSHHVLQSHHKEWTSSTKPLLLGENTGSGSYQSLGTMFL